MRTHQELFDNVHNGLLVSIDALLGLLCLGRHGDVRACNQRLGVGCHFVQLGVRGPYHIHELFPKEGGTSCFGRRGWDLVKDGLDEGRESFMAETRLA